ncbi:glycosyl transferase family 2 [Blautia hydrogenotrophica CAG:147]|uniref:glycosyltransferase family 2 protein n=1 Tax=Blautia hydrogenotrophica TaxID=53443 RepID=UPI0003360027|nr:glycosyltransferase family 2 protein [Blautia hydrogenotrophica]MEE0461932.1 glycosyltransferase family 2 protein [Blautia hydrogenotrophica]CCX59761.1 glycosyl transferase family 2 [Blautia hydrogenotrophica CAG:147]
MRPKISVIIPCFNSSKTILRTLNSLERQTFQEFEVILIDDGSQDNTLQCVQDYRSHSSLQLYVHSQKNFGVSDARNKGIKSANANWLMFLDADDVYHFDCLRILYQTISRGCDTAFGYTSRDVTSVETDRKEIPTRSVSGVEIDRGMELFMFEKERIHFTNFIYSKQLLDTYQISFSSGVKYGEDLEFTWKYLAHCKKVAVVNYPVYGYYNNPHSAVNTILWRKTDLADAMLRTKEYIEKNHPTFSKQFAQYMLPRAIWTVSKTFAVGRQHKMFTIFHNQYHVRRYMKTLTQSARSRLLKTSSLLYLVSPTLFYYSIQGIYHFKNR